MESGGNGDGTYPSMKSCIDIRLSSSLRGARSRVADKPTMGNRKSEPQESRRYEGRAGGRGAGWVGLDTQDIIQPFILVRE